jgi:hypothetical protein
MYIPETFPKFSETCAIAKCLKQLEEDWLRISSFVAKAVISFSDTEFGHIGTIYKASNFHFLGYALGRKATPGKGHGRWSVAKSEGVGQAKGGKKGVYLYELISGVINIEDLKKEYIHE